MQATVEHPVEPHHLNPLTGCPCGCMTKLPWLDDPDCSRHKLVAPPRPAGEYDVLVLGLVPHDRTTCPQCRAVAS